MKKICLTLFTVLAVCQFSFAQWTTSGNNIYNSNSGNLGIGTTTPSTKLDVNGAISMQGFGNVSSLRSANNSYTNLFLGGAIKDNNDGTFTVFGDGGSNYFSAIRMDSGISNVGGINFYSGATTGGANYTITNANLPNYLRMTLTGGNVGIGTQSPLTRLHIVGNGASIDGGNGFSINGDDMAVQANTGGRSTTTGAQLEFVIPANTDGTNLWGQARIITTSANANNGDATGKMILGTRRYFNKLGSGTQWYYGNDIVIDGNGNVGIGTTNPGAFMLAVKGNIHAQQVNVDMNSWADYVFNKDYQLPALKEIKSYIDLNHHLPEMPSEQEVIKDGLNLGEMNRLLTKKVEELTLYLIEQEKIEAQQQEKIKAQAGAIDLQNNKISLQEERISKLERALGQLLQNK